MLAAIYGAIIYGTVIVSALPAYPTPPADPTTQVLNVISAIVGAVLAAVVLFGFGTAGVSALNGAREKNMATALGGIGRGLFTAVIGIMLLGGELIAWLLTVGASKAVPVPGH